LRWMTVAGALTFLTEYPRIDDVHLTWAACLPLATGAVVLGPLHKYLAERWRTGRVARGLLGAALLVVPAATIFPGLVARSEGLFDLSDRGQLAPHLAPAWTTLHLPAVDGVLMPDDQAMKLQAIAAFVAANTAPGEPIFVYPSSPLLYILTERPNPTRFAHLYPGAASSQELEQVISTLNQAPVRLVIVSYASLSFWGPPAQNQPLETYLSQNYRVRARFGDHRVFMR
jgi:hypothetical protein